MLQFEPALGRSELTRIRISVGPERAPASAAVGAPGPMDGAGAR